MNTLPSQETAPTIEDFGLALELLDADLAERVASLDSPCVTFDESSMLLAAHTALALDTKTSGLRGTAVTDRVARLGYILTLFEEADDDSCASICQERLAEY
jgi:hypothetical protein